MSQTNAKPSSETDAPDNVKTRQGVEGEGNRTADRNYRERTTAFAESGKVKEKAAEAAEALDGPQREELEQAEEKGRRAATGKGTPSTP